MRRPRPTSSRRFARAAAAPRISRQAPPVVVRPPSRLAELPPALFLNILEFVLTDDRTHLDLPRGTMRLELQDIALVSKAWNTHAGELMAQLHMGRVLLSFQQMTRQELQEIRRRFTLIGPSVRELRLAVTPPSMYSSLPIDESLLRVTRAAESVLPRMPRLEVLDLRHYCAPSQHLAMVLRAAAKHCPKLQGLLLPADISLSEVPPPGASVKAMDMQPMVSAVYESMKHWYEHGDAGGLRQLRLPTRQSSNRFKHSVEYLTHVVSYCPSIELFDGYAWMPGNVCKDQLIVDRATWKHFSSSCTQLRTFDWNIAPFATEYFEIFGRYPKPQLKELVLTTQRAWDWEQFHREVGIDEAAAIRTSGFGKGAKHVHAVFKACPALKALFIHLYAPISVETMTQLGLPPGVDQSDNLFLNPKNPMNQELFGDAFWEAVVQHCPMLYEVNMIDDDVLATMDKIRGPIMAFTDKSLRALAKLQHLTLIGMKPVNVTGDGVYELVNSPHNQSSEQRNISLFIGEHGGPCDKAFYTAVETLLQRFADAKGSLPCAGKSIALRVANGSSQLVTREWSSQYLRRLKKTIRMVRSKHPWLRFRIAVKGYTDSSFERIKTLEMLTSSRASAPDPSNWEHLPPNTLVDGVFVLEEYCDYGGGLSGGLYDDDDDYDDYGDYDDYDDGIGGGGGYYGDFENERGFYGMGGYHFFNGLQLDDSFHDDYDDGHY